MPDPLPLIVLAGSDGRPGPVPAALSADDMLSGHKGALELPNGRCLAAELVARCRDCGRFAEPILIGPRDVYAARVDCEVIDVSGHLARTLHVLRRLLYARFAPHQPVALIAVDVLPTAEELRAVLADSYDPVAGTHFWWQLIRSEPMAMGASHWKPSYQLQPTSDAPAETMYPGHLIVARPAALRLRLTNHLLQLAYRHRNMPLAKRRLPMAAHGLGRLVRQDVLNLARAQLPLLAVGIPWAMSRAYRRYRHGALTVPELADGLARIFLHRDYRAHADGAPLAISVTGVRSLAKDLDTHAELAEVAAQLGE